MKIQRKFSYAIASVLASALLSGCTTPSPSTTQRQDGHHDALAASRSALSPSSDDVPSDADTLAIAAVNDIRAGRYDEAQLKINKALALRIDRSYYHLLNGLAYHLEAKRGAHSALALAEQGYTQAINFDPANWLAYYFRGRLKIEQGAYDRALEDLAEATMLRPDDWDIMKALAYAAYRTGRPDLAAGVLARLEHADHPMPPSVWRNAAMTMAALGRTTEAESYLERFRASGASERDVRYVMQRIHDWTSITRDASYTNLAYVPDGGANPNPGAASSLLTLVTSDPVPPGGVPYSTLYPNATIGSPQNTGAIGRLTPADTQTAKGTEDKMVVIDVVMISTEDTIATNKGVNLLEGLSLEFGGTLNGSAVPAYSFASQSANGTVSPSTSIIRAITLPSISYNLNILNANNQRSEVLSRPTLVGLAGKQSDFFSGLELDAAAVASSAGTGVSIGGQAININKEIGVKLAVLPTILDDGRLKMAVTIERTFLETPSADVNFTFKLETSKDTLNANVIMRYGETLILGGLSEKETQYTRDGVPGLQDVPGLQYLFSNESRSDYQKSTLFLLTPRPPQYIYQPEKAREEYEKTLSEDERPIANLQARYSDWFKPYPNWASAFHHLQDNGLYREFRTGDVDLESWSAMQSLDDRLTQALDFLRY